MPGDWQAPAGMWWRGPSARGRRWLSPAEDALLLLRLVERHLGSLRGTLVPWTLAEED